MATWAPNEQSLFALSANRAFFLPLSREFVLQRERFRLWKVYAPSLSFFFVFLVFIVMMTYGNYLHRSMLCCTEWKCWSPGSIVLDALCKQPAGFAFAFFSSFLFSPSLSPFSGNVWDTLHKCGRKLCHLRTAQFVYFVTPLVPWTSQISILFFVLGGEKTLLQVISTSTPFPLVVHEQILVYAKIKEQGTRSLALPPCSCLKSAL